MWNIGIKAYLVLVAVLGLTVLAGCPAGDDDAGGAEPAQTAAAPDEAERSPQVEQLELAAEQQPEPGEGAKPRHNYDPGRPLNDQYTEMKANPDIPEETRQILRDQVQMLEDMGMADDALKPGDVAPGFIRPADEGGAVALDAALENGAAVLVFFRGGW